MAGSYQLAPEEYSGPPAQSSPRLLQWFRDWLNHIEYALAWYVDRWQR
jgi:hypothetical protein